MRLLKFSILSATMLTSAHAFAAERTEAKDNAAGKYAGASEQPRDIVVSGGKEEGVTATKTKTPVVEIPQPVTIIDDSVFEAQGAVSVSDTLNYVSGVTANPYGPDSRVDGALVRGISALQFRDGMRDIFSYYASIRADPYNFDRIELVRGPASVLFGQGSLGGIINMVSKTPQFESGGEVSLRYGSFDRKEAMADITGPLTDTVAARIVARVRDSGTQTDYVSDDRVMISPSITFAPDAATTITLIGLYQEDDGGSTSQFLPLVGTILDNPNGQLDNDTFIGKPGWDRYDGRLLQGTAMASHQFSRDLTVNLKARYIDSDLTYLTHYPNSYSSPLNPYLDEDQRLISNYASGSIARMEIFSADNNVQFDFRTGDAVEHTLLAGVDYSWNRVRKTSGYALETIDIYDIDYDALSDFGGTIPMPGDTGYLYGSEEDTKQSQIGFYLQDQIRMWDRVSIVLGARRDKARSTSYGTEVYDQSATTFRAGIIGELVPGISPFASYTESFEPIGGTDVYGDPFVPKTGRQFEAGVKFHPLDGIIVTATAYHIKEANRPVSAVVTSPDDPDVVLTGQLQIGSLTSKGVELEANAALPGEISLIANASYNEAEVEDTGHQLDNVPKFNASLWAMKGLRLSADTAAKFGAGVRHVGKNRSYGTAFPDGLTTPAFTLVDAVAEIGWQRWSLSVNATNLLGKDYYAACLARGDCFMGSERNVYATLGYRF
ncbi:TonB-dependent siderophore receptor [Croceicoccus mobilis]|uniref:Ferrisiderophore receptor n=1 Tax=Croceicoccus mobilis TaxID=1703339 RepID=A0A916ZAM6_9SPHN|nr:TonB-dependent siderophore receptor [Croceicoccus mobilis]GGD82613.1 ferrisiderophore receptor [Croceicoccus mobilis]